MCTLYSQNARKEKNCGPSSIDIIEFPSIFEIINKKNRFFVPVQPPWPEVGVFQGYEGARSLFAMLSCYDSWCDACHEPGIDLFHPGDVTT